VCPSVVKHQRGSCAPRWQRRNRQNTVPNSTRQTQWTGISACLCDGQRVKGGWCVRRRLPMTSQRSSFVAAFLLSRHGTTGSRVSSMTVPPNSPYLSTVCRCRRTRTTNKGVRGSPAPHAFPSLGYWDQKVIQSRHKPITQQNTWRARPRLIR